jgi:hypothetical protein
VFGVAQAAHRAVGGNGEEHGFDQHVAPVESAFVAGRHVRVVLAESDVDDAQVEVAHEVVLVLDEVRFELRRVPVEGTEGTGDDGGSDRLEGADPHGPDRQFAGLLDGCLGPVDRREHVGGRPTRASPAGVRMTFRPWRSSSGGAHLRLEDGQLLGDGRRGVAEGLGGGADRAAGCDFAQELEALQIHVAILHDLIRKIRWT